MSLEKESENLERSSHPLPWLLEDVAGSNLLKGRSHVKKDNLERFVECFDSSREGSTVYLGDGKNLYSLNILPSEDLFGGYTRVFADCEGVCNPQKYDAIMSQGDFEDIVEYVTSVEYAPRYDGEIVVEEPEEVPSLEDYVDSDTARIL